MTIVLDTNVLVSGLLNPHGAPGEIVRLISSGHLTLCYDARILSEYRDVLARPRFQFNPTQITILLDFIQATGHIVAATPLPQPLPDADDEPFLAVAIAGNADYLITGNEKHFPISHQQSAIIVSPTQFIGLFR